jgi:hypothetical protein
MILEMRDATVFFTVGLSGLSLMAAIARAPVVA